MQLTLKARWQEHSTRRGIKIFRRVVRTGSCGGLWMIAGSTFSKLQHVHSYIDNLPAGHFVGPGQIVKD